MRIWSIFRGHSGFCWGAQRGGGPRSLGGGGPQIGGGGCQKDEVLLGMLEYFGSKLWCVVYLTCLSS